MTGIFGGAQPIYAELGIATFPVRMVGSDKKPAITGWRCIGLSASRQLVARHGHVPMLGYVTGEAHKITGGDVDSTDERVFADFLNRHGDTPIKIRTASNKWHALYKYNGERRKIRAFGDGPDDPPYDIIGSGGYLVAPPSTIIGKGSYQIIEGGLHDLDRLPVMRNLPAHAYAKQDVVISPETVATGKRNDTLWRQCMREAKHVNSFDALLLAARTFNQTYLPPLDNGDVEAIARSAWSYEEKGLNHFGQHGAWLPTAEVDELVRSSFQDSMLLLMFLRAHQGPQATFWIANGLAETFGWTVKRFADARKGLLKLRYGKQIRRPWRGTPGEYVWLPQTRVVRID